MLTVSGRINLIKEIGQRLGSSEWRLIDLTLRQFDLPCSETWDGSDRSGYVMVMIENAEEDNLLALGRHLGYVPESLHQEEDPGFWVNGYFRLFVSHLWEHRGFAGEIQSDLLKLGVTSFVAHSDIEPTQEWQNEIEAALATCDAMLVLLHPGFHQSEWTDQEIGYAMGRRLIIVAARYGTTPYGFIRKIQAMEGGQKSAAELSIELFDILRRHRDTRKRISAAVVEQFARSQSFSGAKENMILLEKLTYWDSSLSTKCRSALNSNGQIREAWDVPRRLEQFIERMENGIQSD